MSDSTVKLDLMETGTRYEHYVELREVFASGAEVINGLKERGHDTALDRATLVKLTNAVDVINKRLAFLSDFEKKTIYSAELPTTLRAIDAARRVSNAKSKDSNQVRPPQDQNPKTV